MKKKIIATIFTLSVLGFFGSAMLPAQVSTQESGVNLGVEYGQETGLSATDPRIIVARVIQVFLGLLGVIALVLILYGGFLIMTAAGNEEKVRKGKDILWYAVIGLIIILSAYSITTFVLDSLYTATTGEYTRPRS